MGIIRAFVDDWERAERAGLMRRAAHALGRANLRVRYVAGFATREFLAPLVARSGMADRFAPLFVRNDFFGGNVDVTGLLCGCDVADAVRAVRCGEGPFGARACFVPPARHAQRRHGSTLDDMRLEDMEKRDGRPASPWYPVTRRNISSRSSTWPGGAPASDRTNHLLCEVAHALTTRRGGGTAERRQVHLREPHSPGRRGHRPRDARRHARPLLPRGRLERRRVQARRHRRHRDGRRRRLPGLHPRPGHRRRERGRRRRVSSWTARPASTPTTRRWPASCARRASRCSSR